MPDTLPAQIGAVVTCLVCLLAVWKGALPERAGAILYVFAWVGSLALSNDGHAKEVNYGSFAMDVLAAFGYAAIAWRSRRTWAIWAACFAAVAAATHVVFVLDHRVGVYAYMTAEIAASYVALIALGLGTWNAWREREGRQPPA